MSFQGYAVKVGQNGAEVGQKLFFLWIPPKVSPKWSKIVPLVLWCYIKQKSYTQKKIYLDLLSHMSYYEPLCLGTCTTSIWIIGLYGVNIITLYFWPNMDGLVHTFITLQVIDVCCVNHLYFLVHSLTASKTLLFVQTQNLIFALQRCFALYN